MILEFEKGLVNWIMEFLPDLQEIRFVLGDSNIDTLYEASPRIHFPSVVVSRTFDDSQLFTKSFDYEENNTFQKVFTILMSYHLVIYYDKTAWALSDYPRFRFFVEQNPYIHVCYQLGCENPCKIKVGMRVTGVGMSDIYDPNNTKGGIKALHLSWQSTVPMVADMKVKLIEQVLVRVSQIGNEKDVIIKTLD